MKPVRPGCTVTIDPSREAFDQDLRKTSSSRLTGRLLVFAYRPVSLNRVGIGPRVICLKTPDNAHPV